MQAKLLMRLFTVVESGRITVPLYDVTQHDPNMTNQMFVRQYIATLVSQAFPNVVQYVIMGNISLLVEKVN